MTRVNVVPVSSLHTLHVQGEYKEITRIFTMVRKAQVRGKNRWNYDIPPSYTMGAGHMKFFSDKLGFVLDRYHQITNEMRARGFNVNPVSDEDLLRGIDPHWMGHYTPSEEDMKINQERIDQRLMEMEKKNEN